MEYVKDIRQRSNLVEEHRELLDAISSRDSIKAKELMKTHLLNQQQEVINNIQVFLHLKRGDLIGNNKKTK